MAVPKDPILNRFFFRAGVFGMEFCFKVDSTMSMCGFRKR